MLKALAIKAFPPTIIVFVVLSGSFLATPLTSSKLPACGYGYVGYSGTSAPTVTNVTWPFGTNSREALDAALSDALPIQGCDGSTTGSETSVSLLDWEFGPATICDWGRP